MTKQATFKVSGEMLKQALAMPPGTRIIDIRRATDILEAFIFIVEHFDLTSLREGAIMPELTPIMRVEGERSPRHWLAWDWNQKETEDEPTKP